MSMLGLYISLLALWCPIAFGIWPMPSRMTSGSHVIWLPSDLHIIFTCDEEESFKTHPYRKKTYFSHDPHSVRVLPINLIDNNDGPQNPSCLSEWEIVRKAVGRTSANIGRSAFVPWKFHSRRAKFEPSLDEPQEFLVAFRIHQSICPTEDILDPLEFFNGDESYEIKIDCETTEIKTKNTIGTLRALQTFEQLIYAHSSGTGTYLSNIPISISDSPRWSHRGLSLDIARNVFSPHDVMRTIEAMASVKMSRLHIHATDSQSWPIEVPSLPDLAQKGAYQPEFVWCPRSLQEVQIFGLERGISVFLEIDMPGHTASVAYAYPDLIAGFNEPDWSTFSAEPLSGQLKLNSSAVYDFLDTLFADLLPRLKPYTTHHHGGGDEVNIQAYLLDETVHSSNPQIIKPLLQKFMDYVVEKAYLSGLQPILWEEMLLSWNLTFPQASKNTTGKDPIFQVWRNSEHIVQVLERGHRALFGDYGHWYLDCGHGGFTDPYSGGSSPPGIPYNTSGGYPSQTKDPYLDYCGPYKNWRHIYMYNPLVNVSKALQYLIEGGEVLMWSEQTDPIDIDSKLWPRAAAAAEVLWSGPRSESMIENASKRLGEWRERIVIDHGIRSGPVQMTWCLMEGGCNL